MTDIQDEPSDGSESRKEARELPLSGLRMRQLIALDACTRCGECLTWCPVYDQDAKEAIVPRRKVIDFLQIAKSQHGMLARIMKSPKISPALRRLLGKLLRYRRADEAQVEEFVRNLYECSTCGQCEVVCPAHIETVGLWEELRRLVVEAGYGPLEVQKALVKSVKSFDNPWQQPRSGRTKWARRAIKDGQLKSMPRDIRQTGAKVLLFFGCTAAYDVNVKQVAINNINILEALGVDYGILGSDEKCCASVLLRMGDPEHKRVFQQNIDLFNSLGIETLISSCSGCFKTILQDYPTVAPLNFEVLHTVEFLARLVKQGKLRFPHRVQRTVTYHDPCHLGRATGGFDAPRIIMQSIPGLRLVEMPRSREYSRCCGAGGGLKAGYPDIQNKMAQRRVREAEETGASQLVSCCPFCYQGLNIGITATGSAIVMKDISSLVSEALLGHDIFAQTAPGAEQQMRSDAPCAAPAAADSPAAAREEPLPSEAPERAAAAPPAVSEDAAAPPPGDKEEKERLRAARRAARRGLSVEPAVPAPSAVTIEEPAPPAEADTADDASARAEKERRRAEKRAARRQAVDAGAGMPQEPAPAAPAPRPEAAPQPEGAPTVEAAPQTRPAAALPSAEMEAAAAGPGQEQSPAVQGAETGDREAKRAARRAEREKEKEARRAARTGA